MPALSWCYRLVIALLFARTSHAAAAAACSFLVGQSTYDLTGLTHATADADYVASLNAVGTSSQCDPFVHSRVCFDSATAVTALPSGSYGSPAAKPPCYRNIAILL